MRIFAIIFKDLKQIVQERRSLIILVAMPVAFTLFMGFAYGKSSPATLADTRPVLAWVDQDPGGQFGQDLQAMLADSGAVRMEKMDQPAALEAVRSGKVGGVLVIPAGFSRSIQDGNPAQLTLVSDPVSASGQLFYQIVSQPVTKIMSSQEIARLDVESAAAQLNMNDAQRAAESDAAYQFAWTQWNKTDNSQRVQSELAMTAKPTDPYGGNPYNQASPGILVMFAVFGLVSSAQVVLRERKEGTLARMLTTSLSPTAAMTGHFLAMFSLTFFQQVLLVAFGQLLLGVDYLRAPLGILAVMVALSLAMAGIGLFIGVLAREEQQVSLYSLITMFTLSALGGAWFPLDGTGKAFATLGHLTPTAWAMTGFQNILIRGLDGFSTLLPAGILCAYAVAFILLASWKLKKAG